MTARERFHATMNFGQPDRVPYWEWIGYWEETLPRWRKEGLPEDVHPQEFFGLDHYEILPISIRLLPRFKREVISEDTEYRIERVGAGTAYETDHLMEGAVVRIRKDAAKIMPQFISFPVTDRASWNEFKKRLNPKSPARYPAYWEDYKRSLVGRNYPICIRMGGLFGWPRDWMGLERATTLFYDEPDLMHEIMETITDFVIETVTPALAQIGDIDFARFWEDMCYKNGPLISPRLVREFMLPHYKRMTAALHAHGIRTVLVDCDGRCDALIPIWLEAGINGIYPLECAAGEDPVRLRKEYGKELLMVGGIDKRVLARDKAAIEKEVYAKAPFLIEAGGWIPSVDHAVPPDVPLENYLYYWELIKKIAEPG
jgi:hypothetical protein